MYYRSLFYAFLMVIYGILTYVFLFIGFNTKTKIRVDYQNVSDVYYDVRYIDDNYKNTNSSRYVSSMIKYIDMKYIYNNIISEYVSGYYKYSVDGYLIAYEDDINNSLWERKYKILDEKTILIDGVLMAMPLNGGDYFPVFEDDTVSMNMFGFTPHVFDYLESKFPMFLDNHKEDILTCEYLIPMAVYEQIENNVARVDVLKTDSKWLGVTYKEDMNTVVTGIKELCDNGEYPVGLWNKG